MIKRRRLSDLQSIGASQKKETISLMARFVKISLSQSNNKKRKIIKVQRMKNMKDLFHLSEERKDLLEHEEEKTSNKTLMLQEFNYFRFREIHLSLDQKHEVLH